MTTRARIQRLEDIARRAPSAAEGADWLHDEGWLAVFEAWGREGIFDREPDFPAALASYRAALSRAKGQADPPFNPPADFMRNLESQPGLRLLNWRDATRFPELHAAWDWLAEMARRVEEGIPPVSAAEFDELAEWFCSNDARLCELSLPAQLLDLGGRLASLADIRYGLREGVRSYGAGELAEGLRRLRAFHGGGAAAA